MIMSSSGVRRPRPSSVAQDVGRVAVQLLGVADVAPGRAGILVAEVLLEVEDIDTELSRARRGGDPERVHGDVGVEPELQHVVPEYLLDAAHGEPSLLEAVAAQAAGRLRGPK